MLAIPGALAVLASVGVLTSLLTFIERKIEHHLARRNDNRALQNRFTLRINGRDYYFHESDVANGDSAYEVAIDFCRKEGNQFGLDIQSFHLCTEPIVEALQRYGSKSNSHQSDMLDPLPEGSARLWEINLESKAAQEPIANKEGDSPQQSTEGVSDQPPAALARQQEQHDAHEQRQQTQQPQQRNKDQSLEFTARKKMLELPLEINGVTYLFEYEDPTAYVAEQQRQEYAATAAEGEIGTPPPLHPAVQQERQVQYVRNMAQQLAESFCAQHGEVLLAMHIEQQQQQQLDDNARARLLLEGCRLPVQQSLLSQMQQHMQQMQRRVASKQAAKQDP